MLETFRKFRKATPVLTVLAAMPACDSPDSASLSPDAAITDLVPPALLNCVEPHSVQACIDKTKNEIFVTGVLPRTGDTPSITTQIGPETQKTEYPCSHVAAQRLAKNLATFLEVDQVKVTFETGKGCKPRDYYFDPEPAHISPMPDGTQQNPFPLDGCDVKGSPEIMPDGCYSECDRDPKACSDANF